MISVADNLYIGFLVNIFLIKSLAGYDTTIQIGFLNYKGEFITLANIY
jgi:hypothetical protein